MNNNTTFRQYTESDIIELAKEWISANGYTVDRAGWKEDSRGRLSARAKQEGVDKGLETSANLHIFVDEGRDGFLYGDALIYSHREGPILWSLFHDVIERDRDDATVAAYSAAMPSQEEREKKRAELVEQEQKKETAALQKARAYYDKATTSLPSSHPYIDKKDVALYKGVRWGGPADNSIIVPIYAPSDPANIISYQKLLPEKNEYGTNKLMAPGTHIGGGVFYIGKAPTDGDTLGLCEGYATGATIYSLTQNIKELGGMTVVVTFDCGNMPKAAAALRKLYPNSSYYIFADNDLYKHLHQKQKNGQPLPNSGIEGAKKAAAALGIDEGRIIAPPDSFAKRPGCTDWNDFATDGEEPGISRQTAQESIRGQLFRADLPTAEREAVKLLDEIPPADITIMHDKAAKRGEGVDIGFTMYNRRGESAPLLFSGMVLFAARTNGGKTLTLANVAARVLDTRPNSHVLFLSLEESSDDIYGRILAAYTGGRIDTLRKIGDAVRGGEEESHKSEESRKTWEALFPACSDRIKDHLKIIDLLDVPTLSRIDMLCKYVQAQFIKYGRDAVVCIDYVQKIKPTDRINSSGGYQDMKEVMTKLQPITASGHLVFAGVQMNRTAVTGGSDSGGKKNGKSRHDRDAAEFYGVYAEQAREAADIEQGADIMLYCKIDNEEQPAAVNYRILKNRHGANIGTCSIPCDMSYGALHWFDIHRSTYEDPDEQQVMSQSAIGKQESASVKDIINSSYKNGTRRRTKQ